MSSRAPASPDSSSAGRYANTHFYILSGFVLASRLFQLLQVSVDSGKNLDLDRSFCPSSLQKTTTMIMQRAIISLLVLLLLSAAETRSEVVPVNYTHNGDVLVGYMAVPSMGSGPFPAVVIIP
jgi:hypothetical protein